MINHKTIQVSWLLAGALLFCAPAFAQDGKGEIAGFGGGLAITGGGVNPLVGGSGDVRVIDNLRIFGEFSYSPLNSLATSAANEVSAVTGLNVTAKVKLFDFGGGIDYSFGSSKRVVPYVLAAVGVGHTSVSASVNVNGVTGTGSMSTDSVYLGIGGGVRIYAGRNWGIKPEFRYQRYGGSLASNSAIFTAGLFYQFGK
jgi:hypothetical protein